MFAKTIIDSDAFLDMPHSTQLLYFHLSMRADDDGFVNSPKAIMRNVKCNDDDMKLLCAKKFIIPFDSGIVVIKHWKIHNYIQKDRYTETKYKEEKASLFLDENKAYTTSNVECIQNVYTGKERLEIGKSKARLGKDKEPSPSGEAFGVFWDAYPKKVGKAAAEKAFTKAIKKTTVDRMIAAIRYQSLTDQWSREGGKYIPYPSTWLNQERWNDDLTAYALAEDEDECEVMPL